MGKGGTLILVTHQVHEIPPEVGRVVLLKLGRIVEDGSKGEVLNAPRLTTPFDTPVDLVYYGGWLQVIAASRPQIRLTGQGRTPSKGLKKEYSYG